MGIDESNAYAVMMPDFLNPGRTSNLGQMMGRYQGFDFGLPPTKELELGFHEISKRRQLDVLERLIVLFNPIVSPYASRPSKEKLIRADQLQIVFDLWDDFERGFDLAYTQDNSLYQNDFCAKYNIDPNKPESMMAFYAELLFSGQDKDFKEIESYYAKTQNQTNELLSEEYLIAQIVESTTFQSKYIHELTQFIDSPTYCNYAKTKLKINNNRIIRQLKHLIQLFERDPNFDKKFAISKLQEFRTFCKSNKTFSIPNKKQLVTELCNGKIMQLGNFHQSRWGKGQAFDYRVTSARDKRNVVIGKPNTKTYNNLISGPALLPRQADTKGFLTGVTRRKLKKNNLEPPEPNHNRVAFNWGPISGYYNIGGIEFDVGSVPNHDNSERKPGRDIGLDGDVGSDGDDSDPDERPDGDDSDPDEGPGGDDSDPDEGLDGDDSGPDEGLGGDDSAPDHGSSRDTSKKVKPDNSSKTSDSSSAGKTSNSDNTKRYGPPTLPAKADKIPAYR